MRSIESCIARRLKWTRLDEHDKLAFTLIVEGEPEGEPVAQLTRAGHGRTLSEGIADDGRWTFKRVGIFRPHITVREVGEWDDFAVFEVHPFGRGHLIFGDGRRFAWRAGNFWGTHWSWIEEETGKTVLRFEPAHWLRMEAHVDVDAVGHEVPDRSLLAILGWYLQMLNLEEVAGKEPVTAPVGT
ncbi:MAG TPA: hypothetical protein PLH94_03390 [Fimbriimonadaceae bacterium]|nr:hypothetical protein [Fimbriimonadaceae bacterium]